MGAWASNVDFGEGNDGDIELDLYANYVGKINDTFAVTAGCDLLHVPGIRRHRASTPEVYVGFNAGNFSLQAVVRGQACSTAMRAPSTPRQLHAADRRQLLAGVPRGLRLG